MEVQRPSQMRRAHVLLRLVVLLVIGSACWSSLYWLAYLGVPFIAALLVSQEKADPLGAKTLGMARMLPFLRWVAAAYAYLALLTDALPTGEGESPVVLEIQPGGSPTVASALSRVVTSLPALLVLAVVTMVAGLFWVAGAVAILVYGQLPDPIAGFLTMALQYRMRFLAYHLSLVQAYPSLVDVPAQVPRSHGV
jgi:hypothetical protein